MCDDCEPEARAMPGLITPSAVGEGGQPALLRRADCYFPEQLPLVKVTYLALGFSSPEALEGGRN